MHVHAWEQHCLGTVSLAKHQPCCGTALSLPGVWLKLSLMSRSIGSSMVKRSLLVPTELKYQNLLPLPPEWLAAQR